MTLDPESLSIYDSDSDQWSDNGSSLGDQDPLGDQKKRELESTIHH